MDRWLFSVGSCLSCVRRLRWYYCDAEDSGGRSALEQEHRLSCVLHDCGDASTNFLDQLYGGLVPDAGGFRTGTPFLLCPPWLQWCVYQFLGSTLWRTGSRCRRFQLSLAKRCERQRACHTLQSCSLLPGSLIYVRQNYIIIITINSTYIYTRYAVFVNSSGVLRFAVSSHLTSMTLSHLAVVFISFAHWFQHYIVLFLFSPS